MTWSAATTGGHPTAPRTIRVCSAEAFIHRSINDHLRPVSRGVCRARHQALLLHDGELIRELNRSHQQAGAYDYPIALGALPDGRQILVHCPDAYNVLQIEDAATGERLTAGPREPRDVFHSRLAISPDGQHLLSAGWYWQPSASPKYST